MIVFGWRIGLRNYLAANSNGLSGGLALFWDESIKVELLSMGGRWNVWVHLERGVADTSWTDILPDACLLHLTSVRPDRCPILLYFGNEESQRRKSTCHRYEIM